MCERGFLGRLSPLSDRSCPGNGAIQCTSPSCLVLRLLALMFCIYDSWSSSCFGVFSLSNNWKDRRECERQTFITGHRPNLFSEGQSVATGRCFFLWSYCSSFPVTKHRDPGGDSPNTRTPSHIHTPSPCVTGLIIRSLAARGAEWFKFPFLSHH